LERKGCLNESSNGFFLIKIDGGVSESKKIFIPFVWYNIFFLIFNFTDFFMNKRKQ